MAAAKLDPNTLNNDIGLYWRKSRRIDPASAGLPYTIGELATGLMASTAGFVVTENTRSGEVNITSFEAGQWLPIVYDKVLSGATIDGVAEVTTATGLFWTASPMRVGND